MSLYGLLLRSSWRMTAAAAVACLVGGACGAALIASISRVMNRGHVDAWAAALFGLLVAGKVVGGSSARWLLTRVVQQAAIELRHDLSQRIIAAPLWRLEQVGPARLLSVLIEDVATITHSLVTFPSLAANLAVLVGCTVYLGLLSFWMLGALVVVVVVGMSGYALFRGSAISSLRIARAEQERLVGFFRGLAEGSKELQLNRDLRHAFLAEDLGPAAESVRRHGVRAEDCFIFMEAWTQALFYLLVAAVLFALPMLGPVSPAVLTSYVLTILFMMRPVVSTLQLLPLLGQGKVAMAHLEELSTALSMPKGPPPPLSLPRDTTRAPLASLELAGVTYRYNGSSDSFRLGPADLSFMPGELVFLVGGNGSGKSTLVKLIAGLYAPEGGEVRLNGVPVCDERRDDYRQLFSAIFVDSYSFGRLADHGDPRRLAQAQRYLKEFRLDRKVSVNDGTFQTSGLSQGEQRRLALVKAYLEDRPFYIFDEWAANQDHQFREVFYKRLLPDLRARGKAVLVVTHDERYFAVADRVIRLEEGSIILQEQVSSEAQ